MLQKKNCLCYLIIEEYSFNSDVDITPNINAKLKIEKSKQQKEEFTNEFSQEKVHNEKGKEQITKEKAIHRENR